MKGSGTSRWDFPQFVIAALLLVLAIVQIIQVREQKEIAATQESVALLAFVREYINGYVYLYDIVSEDSVAQRVKEVRRVGLPALAVPSQYSVDHWLIISHSFGRFTEKSKAKKEILHWRDTLKKWEESDKSKSTLFDTYEKKQRKRGVKDLVFLYKADIITHRDYFERIARSKDLFVVP